MNSSYGLVLGKVYQRKPINENLQTISTKPEMHFTQFKMPKLMESVEVKKTTHTIFHKTGSAWNTKG